MSTALTLDTKNNVSMTFEIGPGKAQPYNYFGLSYNRLGVQYEHYTAVTSYTLDTKNNLTVTFDPKN